jgi:hypothetical protein
VGERGAHVGARATSPTARISAWLGRTLWLPERGVAELRWASITLWTMVMLGVVTVVLDPHGGDFHGVLLMATPAAVLVSVAGWSPARWRLGRSRAVRLSVGPFVLAIALVGAGVVDFVTLSTPPAFPFVVLAMAFAATTPGFPIAAAILTSASTAVLVAHWQAVGTPGRPMRS